MLSRRIIPCLDVSDGRVVKGVRFRDHVDVGDIVELALRYRDEGADELVFYDISASPQGRTVSRDWVERVARAIDVPFCVAGGIRSVDDARGILHAGADKISINTPALERPALIAELATTFGAQCVVVGIDSLRDDDGEWRVRQYSGDPSRTLALTRRTLDWVMEAQALGAGEIVLNCMGSDGVRDGYDLPQLRAVRALCRVPLVASGGAGEPAHFADVFLQADVDAALAASVFHSGAIAIPALKRHLRQRGVAVRQAPIERGDDGMNSDMTGRLAWGKQDGLLPAIVQDADTLRVLMLGYMDRAALATTQASGKVTFFSRSRQKLWTKGESSGHFLDLVSVEADCDGDTLLVQARPHGPTCHLERESCFSTAPGDFLAELDRLVAERERVRPEGSYITALFAAGVRGIAQKVGEEGVETALAAVVQDDAALCGEAADLLFHLQVLLRARGLPLADAVTILRARHATRSSAGLPG